MHDGKLARKWRDIQFRRNLRKIYSPKSGITWVFHSAPGKPCEACRLNANHYPECTCGHCPVPVDMVIHRRLSEVLSADPLSQQFFNAGYNDEACDGRKECR